MGKKTITISIIILLVIIGGVLMFMWNKNKEVPGQSGTLIVNNGTAITENIVIYYIENGSYADVPLIEIMKNFGIDVNWIDSDTAEVIYNDRKYILKLSDFSLIELEKEYNLLSPPLGGGKRTRKVLERELVLDSVTILYTLMDMGIRIKTDIDFDKLIVNISERTD